MHQQNRHGILTLNWNDRELLKQKKENINVFLFQFLEALKYVVIKPVLPIFYLQTCHQLLY